MRKWGSIPHQFWRGQAMDLEAVMTVALAMATVMENKECKDPRVPFEV